MNPHTLENTVANQTPAAGNYARENLIAVWPDETWCAYEDIDKMRHGSDDYQVLRVTLWGEDGEPLGFERVKQ